MAMRTRCLVVVAGLAFATPGFAQEVAGTISGTLGLDPAVWYVTSADAERLSGWRWDGNIVEVRLVGHVRRDTASVTEGAMTIVFRTEGNPTEMNVSEFTISITPDDTPGDGPSYTAGTENADLTLEALVISDDEMALAGSFAGRLILGGADELVLQDDTADVTVDGNFQATIPRLPGPSES